MVGQLLAIDEIGHMGNSHIKMKQMIVRDEECLREIKTDMVQAILTNQRYCMSLVSKIVSMIWEKQKQNNFFPISSLATLKCNTISKYQLSIDLLIWFYKTINELKYAKNLEGWHLHCIVYSRKNQYLPHRRELV